MIPEANDILLAVSSSLDISSDKKRKYTGMRIMNAGAKRICQKPLYLYSVNIIEITIIKLRMKVIGATKRIIEDFWKTGYG